MQLTKLVLRALVYCLLMACSAGCASSAPSGGVTNAPSVLNVTDAWSRPVAGGENTVGVAYFVIENSGGPDRLKSVLCDIAANCSVHETTLSDGMARMSEVGGLTIPANSTTALKPGGLHVMLMNMNRALAIGDRFTVTLAFESGKTMPVEIVVRDN